MCTFRGLMGRVFPVRTGSAAASQTQKEHLLWTGMSGHSQACGEEARVCFADVSVMFIILDFSKSN